MRTRSQKQAKLIGRIITYTILIAAAIVCLFPFIWMISTSFKETSDIYKMPPSLLPANPTLENFIEGWKGADFGMFFQNSAVVTFLATIGTVFSSSVVAYGFARFKSRLSPVLFMILLGTMMLPSQVTLIPQYLLYYKLGMVDTFWPLIIPSWLGGELLTFSFLFSSLERFRRNWMKRLRLMGRILAGIYEDIAASGKTGHAGCTGNGTGI